MTRQLDLDELRSTLTEHAEGLQDAPHARVAAVHHRVAVARRRRTTALTGVAVVAVLAVALAVVPPMLRSRDSAPADGDAPARLAGRAVPRTQTATGFSYRYVRGSQSTRGARSLDTAVRVGREPRLVMWASSDTTSVPVLRLGSRRGDLDPEIGPAGGFDRYLFLSGSGDGSTRTERLRLTQTGATASTRLALAVYDLHDPTDAGIGDGTTVLRRTVAGESLVKGAVGRPGVNDLSLDVRIPSTDLSWAVHCSGSTRWGVLDVDGAPMSGFSCSRTTELDPGLAPSTYEGSPFPAGVHAGDTVHLRLHLAPDSRHDSEVARDADVRLVLGLYTRTAPTHLIAGTRVPDASESGGHEWRAARWERSGPGGRSVRVTLPASDRPRLVSWVATQAPAIRHEIRLRVLPRGGGQDRAVDEAYSDDGGGASGGSGYVVQPGETPSVVLRIVGAAPTSRTRLGLVFSDLVH